MGMSTSAIDISLMLTGVEHMRYFDAGQYDKV